MWKLIIITDSMWDTDNNMFYSTSVSLKFCLSQTLHNYPIVMINFASQ